MPQTYTPSPPATSATPNSFPWVPLVAWALTTLGALLFVLFVPANAPYADEWEFVAELVGDEPRLPWLWQQHNEHRLPLPRVVVLAYFTLTRDFRAGSFLQVAMLSAMALFLMRLAARLRGRAHWADAFFPISLLHVGHWENLVMGYQVCFVLFAALATGLAVTALRTTRATAFRSGLIAGAFLLLIALTGGSGLTVVPAVAVWLLALVASVWRDSKGKALLLLLVAALPFVYLGAYFVGYSRPPHHPSPCTNPLAVARVAGEVLAVSIGIGVYAVWFIALALILTLGVITLVLLKRKWAEHSERLAIVGLVAVAAGVTSVAVAIGVGRGEWGAGMGLWSRYSLLVWPLLGMAYLTWVKYGSDVSRAGGDSRPVAPKAGLHGRSKWIPISMCLAAALAFPANTGFGMVFGAKVASDYSAIAGQAKLGLPAEAIARSPAFAESHHGAQGERAVRAIPLLRRERIGIFAR